MNQCGFDVGKKSSSYCVRNGARTILEEGKVSMKEAALRAAFTGKPRMRFVLEASTKSFWVADVVESLGHEAVVVDAAQTKALVSARRSKTDKKDARVLAELGALDFLRPVARPTREQRLAKMKLRVRQSLVRQRSELMARVRSLVDSEGGELGPSTAESFTKMVRASALPDGLMPLVAPLLQVLDGLSVQVKQLDAAVEAWAKQDETARRLQTVPGVGPLVAASFVAVIREPTRFAQAASVASYVGLVPTQYESGQTSRKGHISRAGDAHLRWMLTMAANGLLRAKSDSALRRWGLALAAKSGRKKAVVAVARKLAAVLWKLWRDGTTFEARLEEARE